MKPTFKKLKLTLCVVASLAAAMPFSAKSAVVLVDDFTGGMPQIAVHRIGGGVTERPTATGGYVYKGSMQVTTGTELTTLFRTVAARQSGSTWNNYASFGINTARKYFDSADMGAVNMGVDPIFTGDYGDFQLTEEFAPIAVNAASYVEIVVYGVCAKTNTLTVTASNGAKANITINSHSKGTEQTYRIPVSAFNQPGFPVLNNLSSLKLDTRAIESTRFAILKIRVGGVNAPQSCPSSPYSASIASK